MSGATERHDAAHLVGQQLSLVLVPAPMQERLAEIRHVAVVDGRTDDDPGHGGEGELCRQTGKNITSVRFHRDAGYHLIRHIPLG